MKVAIVGAGISGLFCAYHLIKAGIEVDLFEKENSLAKKFLVAGKSGLNITSAYPLKEFHNMYFDKAHIFEELIKDYSPQDTINWLKELGFETFEGSSYKVFPKEFKAAKILKTIKDTLLESNLCRIINSKELIDFDSEFLLFKCGEKYRYEKAIFALGGGSWKRTGSSGEWLKSFQDKGISCEELKSSNCGFRTNIKLDTRIPLKNISVSFKELTLKGEALIFDRAIEGGVIYHLSSYLREELKNKKTACVLIDFKPSLSTCELENRLSSRNMKVSWPNHVKKTLKIDAGVLDLIKSTLSKNDYFDTSTLTKAIKSFKLDVMMSTDIDKAISTAGGVSFEEVNEKFQIKKYPNIYLTGEMLDWEAPTGGFLIQGCYSISNRIIKNIKLTK